MKKSPNETMILEKYQFFGERNKKSHKNRFSLMFISWKFRNLQKTLAYSKEKRIFVYAVHRALRKCLESKELRITISVLKISSGEHHAYEKEPQNYSTRI